MKYSYLLCFFNLVLYLIWEPARPPFPVGSFSSVGPMFKGEFYTPHSVHICQSILSKHQRMRILYAKV